MTEGFYGAKREQGRAFALAEIKFLSHFKYNGRYEEINLKTNGDKNES